MHSTGVEPVTLGSEVQYSLITPCHSRCYMAFFA